MRNERRSRVGISRATLVMLVAVVAAALVLGSAALRSGPSASPLASPGPSAPNGPSLASLPATPTETPPVDVTQGPPEPTAPAVRGAFVGALGHFDVCPILFEREGVLELVLPDGYRGRVRRGEVEIIGPTGAVVATEGDILGLDGRVRDGGSFCMVGPQLHVSRIVEVRPRETQ